MKTVEYFPAVAKKNVLATKLLLGSKGSLQLKKKKKSKFFYIWV